MVFLVHHYIPASFPLLRACVWLVALGKLNAIENLQTRRPTKSLNAHIRIMCLKDEENCDNFLCIAVLQRIFGLGNLRLEGESGWLREELGISYSLIFMGLVAIEISRSYGCVVVMQFYGLSC